MRRVITLAFAGLAATAVSSRAADQDVYQPASVVPLGAHSCVGFYPEAARKAGVTGTVSLSFHIDTDGLVTDMHVTASSGSVDLDDAAKSCARTWHYEPVVKNGKPVEAAWKAVVDFEPAAETTPTQPRAVLISQDNGVCRHYPWWALRHHAEGNARVNYTLSPDGTVDGIVLAKSSGDSDLDEAATSCVKSLKFRPNSGGDAPRTLSARFSWSYVEHGSPIILSNFEGVISLADEMAFQITDDIAKCLRGAVAHAEFDSGLSGKTTLRLMYHRGELRDVSVLQTSGNDGLDRYAAGCYKAEPANAERAEALRHVVSSFITVPWSRFIHP